MHREIVVGTDGSSSSTAAVQWAAHEAVRRQVELWVVHVIGHEPTNQEIADGRAVLNRTAAAAREADPDVRVISEIRNGDVVTELLDEAANADILVLGSRGHGSVVGLMLGSVCQHVAGHTTGPVIVVRETVDAEKGEIVVGFDGSAEARRAVEFAFEEAKSRQARLRMISAWMAPMVTGFDVGWIDTDETLRTNREFIKAELATWRKKYPLVEVDAGIRIGHAASVLSQASASADLVILGSRGHSALRSTFLGSVGTEVLLHSRAPVAVVGPEPRRHELVDAAV